MMMFFVCVTVHFYRISMSLQQKMSELTGIGCNGHSSSVPYESDSLYSHIVSPDINPFVHRLQFSAMDKLRVRIHLPFSIRIYHSVISHFVPSPI